MNESTFRSLFREAIGEAEAPPYLGSQARQALKQSIDQRSPRLREGLVVLAALVVAIAVVAVLLGPRMFPHVQQPVGVPSPSPSPLVPSPSPDANACRLPVIVDDETSGTRKTSAGFIDVASGQFAADSNVSFADLPYGYGSSTPIDLHNAAYDPVVKRWLPSTFISPDQRSYLYVTDKAGSSELHMYNVAQRTDITVWTSRDAILYEYLRWRSDGIYAQTTPFGGAGGSRAWRIDPVSGQATEIDMTSFMLPYPNLVGSPGRVQVEGLDPDRAVYITPGRITGAQYTAFVIIDGKRTDIYSGVMGDQMDFDPVDVWYDGPRLWFANFDAQYLWSWTAATALTRHSVQIPGAPRTATHFAGYSIAGPCV